MRARFVVGAALILATACSSGAGTNVEVAEVTGGEVTQTVAAPAVVEPEQRATVSAPAGGEVVEVLAANGDRVEAGQPVLRLSSDELSAALAQAQAGVDAAGALTGVSVPSVDLSPLFGAVRAQLDAVIPPLLDAAEAAAQQLPEEQRAAALLRIAEARADQQRTSRELAAAERDAERSREQASAAQRAAAAAQRERAEAALAAAQEREESLTITAPIAGVLEFAGGGSAGAQAPAELPDDLSGLLGGGGGGSGGTGVALGARVGFGQLLFTVYDLSGFHIAATVDEVDAVLVDEGQAATVYVDAFPDAVLRGQVRHVGIGPVTGAGGGVVYPVEVALTDVPDEVRFRVGMTASIEVAVRTVRADTVVPSRALLRRDDRDVVLVVRDGDHVRVAVEVLALGEDDAAVRSDDLEPGDEVVVAGFEEVDAADADGDAGADGDG